MDKNNPNASKVIKALTEVVADAESLAIIEKQTGKYEWIIGNDVELAMKSLKDITTGSALQNLVWFVRTALGQDAVVKIDLVSN